MNGKTLVLIAVTLLPAAGQAAEDPAWEAAFALADPAQAEEAWATLKQMGPRGFDVLAKVARVGGTFEPFAKATEAMGCQHPHAMPFGFPRSLFVPADADLPRLAAERAVQMLRDDPALAQSKLVSSVAFERALAVLTAAGDEQRLMAYAKSLASEQDGLVLTCLKTALTCEPGSRWPTRKELSAQVAAEVESIERRLSSGAAPRMCGEPNEKVVAYFVDGLAAGEISSAGWSASRDSLTLLLRKGEQRLEVSPACALAIYDGLAARKAPAAFLLDPILTLDKDPERKAAAERATRDLVGFPEDARNELAAALVVAGFASPIKVELEPKTRSLKTDRLLKAAAMQGSKEALERIERAAVCPEADRGSAVALLSLLPNKRGAPLAFDIAQRCPGAPRAAAVLALVEMGDPRAAQYLGDAFDEPAYSMEIQKAIRKGCTPAIGAELERLAKTRPRAAALLTSLRAEGIFSKVRD
ncbi:MAG: hypothetical protein ACOX6T_07415 [Myxococcales bacterium]